jgi:poly-gamma-glutamate capsule biosynthesis protein CapA/YwtB (metallophosphatase superfamily)
MSVRLLAAGDICPGDHYFSLGHGTGSHLAAGANPFATIERLLRDADVRIANLEGPLSASSSNAAGPEADVFRGPPGAAALLREASIDLVHVANNHVLQHGADAFRTTIALLEDQDISPVGLLKANRSSPVVRTVNGLVLGFLGYSFVPERYLPDQLLYAAAPLSSVLGEIEALKRSVDLVVMSVHWGEEATALPGQHTVDAAHAMIRAGATLVLGHHPHWFQPVERVGRALIAYSLGDFVFDLFWDRRLVESAILSIDLDSAGVVEHRLIPVRFDTDYKLRLQTDPNAKRFLAEIRENARVLSQSRGANSPAPAARWGALRKLAYFLSVFHRGNTFQKARFVFGKIENTIRRGVHKTRGSAL